MKEKVIIDKFVAYFGRSNVIRFVPSRYSVRGICDLCVSFGHYDVWIELKTGNQKLTKLQERFLRNRTFAACFTITKNKFIIGGYGKQLLSDSGIVPALESIATECMP